MPNESRVHHVPVQAGGRATHAIVIGVGAYPHLEGGTGAPYGQVPGLGQLTSPPVSARAIAKWLIEKFSNRERPLASVRLLLSEKSPKKFDNPTTGESFDVPRATIANIREAVREWRIAGATDAGNLALFYFCGHGLGNGLLLSLLAADFGEDPADSLASAINFSKFRNGMRSHLPKQQCYFVDACRSDTQLIAAANNAGVPFVTPMVIGGPKSTEQPTFYATMEGEEAQGKKNQVSYYTQALIDSLDRAGMEDRGTAWVVSTTRLVDGLSARMARTVPDQVPNTDAVSPFLLHWHAGVPEVDVFVVCDPEDELARTSLEVLEAGNKVKARPPAPSPWELRLPAGRRYTFAASKPAAGPWRVDDCLVKPPEVVVPIKVGS